jgi:cobalt/nickel transport system ATP-binding protein
MLLANDITVQYPDGTKAVDVVRFAIESGESVALIGANGAGKTSLLLSLVGVLPLSGGTIEVDGVSLDKKSLQTLRAKVGLVFQNPDDQLFMPSIFDDVAFGPRNFGCSEPEVGECVDAALSKLGILSLAERSPLKLSGGEKRLAAIATVLSMRPEYMLFDEPTAFLDPKAKRNLARLLSELPQGKIIATHDLNFAAETCSRVLLLQRGKLADDDGVALLQDAELLENAGL